MGSLSHTLGCRRHNIHYDTTTATMNLDVYTQHVPLTQKARFWGNFVSALKGGKDLYAAPEPHVRNFYPEGQVLGQFRQCSQRRQGPVRGPRASRAQLLPRRPGSGAISSVLSKEARTCTRPPSLTCATSTRPSWSTSQPRTPRPRMSSGDSRLGHRQIFPSQYSSSAYSGL